MNKINISICAGTMCHVMGGAHLHDLEKSLPIEMRDRIVMSDERCPGFCLEQETYGKPPYAKVGGEVVSDASLMTLLEKVKTLLVAAPAQEEG